MELPKEQSEFKISDALAHRKKLGKAFDGNGNEMNHDKQMDAIRMASKVMRKRKSY